MILCCVAALSMAMQDGPMEGMGRKRFGPDAYWRQAARPMGTWRAVGKAQNLKDPIVRTDDLPVKELEFDQNRNVSATMPSGESVKAHQWFLKNQYTWLHWYAKSSKHPERAEVPLEFRDQRLYIAWPPNRQNEGHLVFERAEK